MPNKGGSKPSPSKAGAKAGTAARAKLPPKPVPMPKAASGKPKKVASKATVAANAARRAREQVQKGQKDVIVRRNNGNVPMGGQPTSAAQANNFTVPKPKKGQVLSASDKRKIAEIRREILKARQARFDNSGRMGGSLSSSY